VRSGIAFLPYFPLANGLLTGKYRHGQPVPAQSRAEAGFGPKVFTDKNLALVEALISYATSRVHTLLDLASCWLLGQPTVASVIAGAKTAEQVRANAAAVEWKLSPSEFADVDAILAGEPR
jgi:aryl-alcohol dehydrogenase-like predicted oxidoreductase